MKFMVKIEDRGFGWDVDIEADTIEDAVRIATEEHCQPRMVEVTPHPTWAEPYPEDAEEGTEIYELTHEVSGNCADCGVTIFSRGGTKHDDWPWSYASGDEGCYTEICYPCAVKRKDAGNFCPRFDSFYLRPCCPHDD